jgi:hypothetical protein
MRYFCMVALVLIAPHVRAGAMPVESLSDSAIETLGATSSVVVPQETMPTVSNSRRQRDCLRADAEIARRSTTGPGVGTLHNVACGRGH